MILNHDIEWWHIPWYWTTTLNLDTSQDIEPWHEIPHWIHDKNYNRSIEPWHKPQHDSWYWIMTLTMALSYNINHDINYNTKLWIFVIVLQCFCGKSCFLNHNIKCLPIKCVHPTHCHGFCSCLWWFMLGCLVFCGGLPRWVIITLWWYHDLTSKVMSPSIVVATF